MLPSARATTSMFPLQSFLTAAPAVIMVSLPCQQSPVPGCPRSCGCVGPRAIHWQPSPPPPPPPPPPATTTALPLATASCACLPFLRPLRGLRTSHQVEGSSVETGETPLRLTHARPPPPPSARQPKRPAPAATASSASTGQSLRSRADA